ncbi:MAG: lysylphosphatidylglycerol synthase transmembrane domain-containing protein [Pseudomonadota bacterium]
MIEKRATPQSTGTLSHSRKWWPSLAGAVLAAAVVAALIKNTSLIDAGVWSALARYSFTIGAIGVAAAGVQSLISTFKWRMLLMRALPDAALHAGFDRLFAYTAVSNLLAQFLPAYIAAPLVRGAAMRSQHEAGFAQNAMISAYEQVFDVAMVAIGGGLALVLLAAGFGMQTSGIILIAIALLLAPLILAAMPEALRPGRLARILPRRWRFTARLRDGFEGGSDVGFDAPRFMGALGALSALRYAAIGVRTVLLGILLLPDVAYQTLGLAFAAVQISAVAVITPGNLGVTELGWGAMASFSTEATVGEFVAFALALRLISLLSSACVAVCSLLAFRDR